MIKKVLLVDDAPINVTFLEMFFLHLDIEVVMAMRASEVYDIIEETSFGLSFVDYHMPDEDGRVLLQNLQAQGKIDKLGTIYMLTADVDFQPTKMGLGNIVTDCLYKPLNVEELESKVFSELKLKPTGS